MRRTTKGAIALGAALAMALLPAAQASADIVQGYRSCPSPAYSMTTGSYTASGTVAHFHASVSKYFNNTGFKWRYFTAGYQSTDWSIVYAGPITSWNTSCLN
jgi:opacity protein-like surface antigen